jgi:quercetin dioxygenase-like cupin family protein
MSAQGQQLAQATAETRKAYWGAGGVYEFLATGEQTDGAYFAMEAIESPGGGPPPHVHLREQESFYVVEGRCTIHVGDKTISAAKGDFVSIPKGTVHHFRNDSDRALRMIVTFVPAGMEHFFEEALDPVNDRSAAPPPLSPEMVERMLAAAPKHGLEILCPAAK